MMSRNRNRVLPLALTVAFCAMFFVVSAQNRQTMPSAVLVHEKCYRCYEFDTLCQFKYGDIVLMEDSITFKDMDCIYHCVDSGISFLNGAYLIFSFPNGNRYIMELFSYFSSFVPQYSPIIFREDWGNTLPLQPTFSEKDWTKSLKKFVKKWNSYADDDEDFMFGVDIIDGDTIFLFPEFFPKFPGGTDSLRAFVLRETQYPDDPLLDAGGVVRVKFIVDKDGSISKPVVITSLHPKCDEEAVRVIMSMPKWQPGTLRGLPVRCYYDLPVTFWR